MSEWWFGGFAYYWRYGSSFRTCLDPQFGSEVEAFAGVNWDAVCDSHFELEVDAMAGVGSDAVGVGEGDATVQKQTGVEVGDATGEGVGSDAVGVRNQIFSHPKFGSEVVVDAAVQGQTGVKVDAFRVCDAVVVSPGLVVEEEDAADNREAAIVDNKV